METSRQSKLAAIAGNAYDHSEGRTGSGGWTTRSSKSYAKRVTSRKVRRELKDQLRKEAILDYEDAVWAASHARRLAELIRRKAGFGANAVTIENGRVIIL